MTPDEAIQLLTDATGHDSFAMNRRSHLAILQALEVLREFIKAKELAAKKGK